MAYKVTPGSMLEKLVPLREIHLPAGGSPDVARGVGVLNHTVANRAGEQRIKKNELVKAAVKWIGDGMPLPIARGAAAPGSVDPTVQAALEALAAALEAQKQAQVELEAEVGSQGEDISAIRKLIERMTAPGDPAAEPAAPELSASQNPMIGRAHPPPFGPGSKKSK